MSLYVSWINLRWLNKTFLRLIPTLFVTCWKCGDIKPSELDTVKTIADKNINGFLNIVTTVLGLQNKDVFRRIFSLIRILH